MLRMFKSKPSPSPSPAPEELPPLPPLQFHGYKPTTTQKLLTHDISSNIRNLLPPRLQLFNDWYLIYSLDQHGISLNTLYNNSKLSNQIHKPKIEKGYGDQIISRIMKESPTIRRPVGYVLIVKDNKNNKFGAYLNENLKPMDHKRYYGNGESFLWKQEHVKGTKDHRFKAFMYTGINDNIIYSNHDFIAIGSSNGQNGLYINKSLEEGISYRCETFGNEILNGDGDLGGNSHKFGDKVFGKFEIRGIELWRVGSLD